MMRRALAILVVVATSILLVGVAAPSAQAAPATASFTKTSDWGSGFEGRYTITNGTTAPIQGWTVAFDLPAGHSISSFWDASMTRSGQRFTFSNVGWNGSIAPGASVTFGFIGSPGGTPAVPTNCTLNGSPCGGGDGGGGGPTVPGVPGTPSITATTNSSISLSWTASSGTVSGYRIYEGSSVRATVSGTTATISSLAACSTHTYTVRAFNAQGESAASGSVSATTSGCAGGGGALPRHTLTGYWHNFANAAVELRLSAVPNDYDIVAVAFAEATATPGQVTFQLDPGLSTALGGYTDAQFRADVQTLHSRGKKVILSVGGELGRVQVNSSTAATAFADSFFGLMQSYGFDGVDIDLENGLNPTFMAQALRQLRSRAGAGLIITLAPQTIDMQSTGASYFQLALDIRDILTIVHTQFYNSGSMLGCDQQFAYSQGTINFITALACIQLENGLRPDQVALGLPAGPGAAGGGVVAPTVVNAALDCLARRTNCGSFVPPRSYPDIRGAMTWSINWDAAHNWNFSRTVKPHLATLP